MQNKFSTSCQAHTCQANIFPITHTYAERNILTHIRPLLSFYTTVNTFGFLVFSGCIKQEHWPDMGCWWIIPEFELQLEEY